MKGKRRLALFTKVWTARHLDIAKLGAAVKALGFDSVELPVRPGCQVEPGPKLTARLKEAQKALAGCGVEISSIAGNADRETVEAMGEAGLDLLRIMAPIDMKTGYMKSIAAIRKGWDALLPELENAKVTLGVQNHCDNFIGSAIGILHLTEPYDPKLVATVLDCSHTALVGEPELMAIDIAWPRLAMVNFKSAFRKRVDGPEEEEARYVIHWTTSRHAGYSWKAVVQELARRGYDGDFCMHPEYSDASTGEELMGDAVVPYLKTDVARLKRLLEEANLRRD